MDCQERRVPGRPIFIATAGSARDGCRDVVTYQPIVHLNRDHACATLVHFRWNPCLLGVVEPHPIALCANATSKKSCGRTLGLRVLLLCVARCALCAAARVVRGTSCGSVVRVQAGVQPPLLNVPTQWLRPPVRRTRSRSRATATTAGACSIAVRAGRRRVPSRTRPWLRLAKLIGGLATV